MGNKPAKTAEKQKEQKNFCKYCGKEVKVVLFVPARGRRKMKRICCEQTKYAISASLII